MAEGRQADEKYNKKNDKQKFFFFNIFIFHHTLKHSKKKCKTKKTKHVGLKFLIMDPT